MLREFREFALKGNVVDMAVGIIIGGAFTGIVTSLVNDVLMPPLGYLTGRVDFSQLYLNLTGQAYASLAEAEAAGAAVVRYGQFLNASLNFLLVAFAVFLLVKQINALRRMEPPPAPNTHPCPWCLQEIKLAARRCPHCTAEVEPAV